MNLTRILPLALLATTVSASASYTNAKYGFTVTAPAGWKQVSYPGTEVVFTGPAAGGFATNANLVVTKLPAGFTLKQYETQGREQLAKLITNYKFVSRRALTLGGLPAFQQVFSGQQGKFNLYYIQTVALRKGDAYVLTATALQQNHAGLPAAVDGIVRTFTFKN